MSGAAVEPLPEGARRLAIELPGFEGPLDLLLHLIRKHELDILNIPIGFITEEYLGYIDAMTALELAVAGEYLVMAATLLQIKSQMLLPRAPRIEDDDEDGPQEDPRQVLVRRLLEYQRYKDAAMQLASRSQMGRDVFVRPSRAAGFRDDAGPAELLGVDLYLLLDAYRKLVATRPAAKLHEVTQERLSLRETIARIADFLVETPRTTLLDVLYRLGPEPTTSEIVIAFLALLEMAKLRMVRLFQARLTSADLIVERAVLEPGELEQQLDGLEDEG